jgi:TatA/E family protein of Tat protein translocase
LERFDSAPALLYDALERRNATSMLSVPHLIIIFLVALVVFGPQKLPELARTLGRVMAEFRKATGDLRSTFDEHMRELEREAQLHDLRLRDEERGRENARLRAQLESVGQIVDAPAPGTLMTGTAPASTDSTASIDSTASTEQLALPSEGRQGELPLGTPSSLGSPPAETVPRRRPDADAKADTSVPDPSVVDRH